MNLIQVMSKLSCNSGLIDQYLEKEGRLKSKIPPSDYNKSIRFSLKHCCEYLGNTDFCLLKIRQKEARNLYKKLGYFEKFTWKDVVNIPHDKGFSMERKKDKAYKKLSAEFPSISNFFHFRVGGVGTGVFRVFGGRKDDLCYLLLFDRTGKIHFKKH